MKPPSMSPSPSPSLVPSLASSALVAAALSLSATGAWSQQQQQAPASPGFLTLYGFIDAGAGALRDGRDTTSHVVSGTSTASRWGIRLREDLGSGLAAIANLESGFQTDTGSHTISRAWSRASNVGLSSASLGELTLGRQLNPQALSYGAHQATWATGPGYWGLVSGFIPLRIIFSDNAVVYRSPQLAGFTARALWSPGHDSITSGGLGDDAAVPSAGQPRTGRQWGLSLGYGAGALSASLGTQWTRLAYNAATGQLRDFRETTASGSYDLGSFKLFVGAYVADDDSVADDARRAVWLGTTIPVGAGRWGLQVGHRRDERQATPIQAGFAHTGIANDGRSASATVWSAYYDHALSRRTSVFVSWATTRNSAHATLPLGNGDGPLSLRAAAPGADPSALTAGVRHAF